MRTDRTVNVSLWKDEHYLGSGCDGSRTPTARDAHACIIHTCTNPRTDGVLCQDHAARFRSRCPFCGFSMNGCAVDRGWCRDCDNRIWTDRTRLKVYFIEGWVVPSVIPATMPARRVLLARAGQASEHEAAQVWLAGFLEEVEA